MAAEHVIQIEMPEQLNGEPEMWPEFKNMKLVVDAVDGRTFVIPLQVQGHQLALQQRNPPAGDEAEDVAEGNRSLDQMRGWIMTVAALFATMSFEAMNQRPSWMVDPDDGGWKHVIWRKAHTPAEKVAAREFEYALINTMTFSESLAVVAMMLVPRRSSVIKVTLTMVRPMMFPLFIFVAINFSFMITKDVGLRFLLLAVMILYPFFMTITSLYVTLRQRSPGGSAGDE